MKKILSLVAALALLLPNAFAAPNYSAGVVKGSFFSLTAANGENVGYRCHIVFDYAYDEFGQTITQHVDTVAFSRAHTNGVIFQTGGHVNCRLISGVRVEFFRA